MSEYDKDPNAKARLLKLLNLRLGKDISYDDFREEFMNIYNFQLDHSSVPPEELDALERLFNVVGYYSPVPEDRASYPRVFRDEKDVERATEQARREIGV